MKYIAEPHMHSMPFVTVDPTGEWGGREEGREREGGGREGGTRREVGGRGRKWEKGRER